MNQAEVVDIAQKALMTVLYVSAPMLGLSMIVGLIISIFQASTQIQEQTLTFVPKIIAVIAAIALFGAWMLNRLIDFTYDIYANINYFINY